MIRYVVGFVFSENYQHVLLIRKVRPRWQAGLLNGPGGKIEPGETATEAVRREVREETGVDIPEPAWHMFLRLDHERGDWKIYFFAARESPGELYRAWNETREEQPIVVSVDSVRSVEVVPNLHWLIPMAMQSNVSGIVIDSANYENAEGATKP